VENILSTLQKIKIELLYDLQIPFLDLCVKELKPGIQTNTCPQMSGATAFMIAKKWKEVKCLPCPSMDSWRNKTETCYSVVRRNTVLIHATNWMELKNTTQVKEAR
jgi:hypothetical protein